MRETNLATVSSFFCLQDEERLLRMPFIPANSNATNVNNRRPNIHNTNVDWL